MILYTYVINYIFTTDQDLRAKDMKDIIKRLENLEKSKHKMESGVNDDKSKIKEENAKLEMLETGKRLLLYFVVMHSVLSVAACRGTSGTSLAYTIA